MTEEALTHRPVPEWTKRPGAASASLIALAALAAVLALCVLLAPSIRRDGTEPVAQEHTFAHTRALRYRYTLRNTTDRVRRGVALWTDAPVSRTSFQRAESLVADAPYTLSPDALGNRLLRIEIGDLPPFATRVVDIRATLGVAALPQPAPLDDPAPYLAPGDGIQSDHPGIRKVAERFRQDPPLQRAKGLYGWVVDNLRLSAYRPRARGAARAFEMRGGDCTEFAQLYAALARAAGLPARVLAGYRYRDSALLRGEDLHNWAEVHLEGTWRVVDPHVRRFLQNEDRYIAMTVIGRPTGHPLGGHRRHAVSDAKVSVEMD